MTEKEMIEEMAHTLYCKQDKFDLSNPFEVAKAVVEEGYRKTPKEAVVLTREEFDEIKQYQGYIPELKKAFDKIRKETAREILDYLKARNESTEHIFQKCASKLVGEDYRTARTDYQRDLEMFFNEIAEQYGVEVKE